MIFSGVIKSLKDKKVSLPLAKLVFFVEYIYQSSQFVSEKKKTKKKTTTNRKSKLKLYSYFNHGHSIDPWKCKERVLTLVKRYF